MPKFDAYQFVTDQIIEQLEAGTAPWQRSWAVSGSPFGGMPRNFRGNHYRGINVLLLWCAGRSNPNWMTFKQAQSIGAQVRKGEKGTKIVFFKQLEVADRNAPDQTKRVPMLRVYTVFNAEQIDGLPDRFFPKPQAPVVAGSDNRRFDDVDAYIACTGAAISHGGDRAFFQPSTDSIRMPELERFTDSEAYYGTLLHELTHWTGHESRLDRQFGGKFGDSDYAFEELVAEIGAAMACAKLDIEVVVREDHAAYVASWLKTLKGDKKAIFAAARLAQKACDHLDEYQPQAEMEAA